MKHTDFCVNILTTEGPQYDYLIHQLESNFQVNIVIRESGRYQRIRYLQHKKYWRYFCNRYQWLIRSILGYNRYRSEYFAFGGKLNSNIIDVDNINSISTIEIIKKNPCNLYIVMGTSILTSNVLNACSVDLINIHGGYLPYYRGNNCIYFAYVNSDFDKIANTIHFIDSGIDTGNIIKIVRPTMNKNDTPDTLYCKAKKMAIDKLIEIVNQYKEKGSLPSTPQVSEQGHLYKTEERNPITDLKNYFKLKNK